MGDLDNRVGRLDVEADYAARTFDRANFRFEQANEEQDRFEHLRTAATALNALGNLRLAQAMLLTSDNS
ncbi:hypothetical protein [Amycolatopsis sp. NPDC051371]|uniref:hypothetical protein n=1 Tax=Amycolatopsis sp. NPDC051371 TaxID=3155800 RepID=UPI00341CE026